MGLDFPSIRTVFQKRHHFVVLREDEGLTSIDIVPGLCVKSNGIRVVSTFANTYFPPGREQIRIDIHRPIGSGSHEIAGVPSFSTVEGIVGNCELVVAV